MDLIINLLVFCGTVFISIVMTAIIKTYQFRKQIKRIVKRKREIEDRREEELKSRK